MNLLDPTFTNILQIIKDSRENALRQVNTQLIIMLEIILILFQIY